VAPTQWLHKAISDPRGDTQRRHNEQFEALTNKVASDALISRTQIKFHATDQRDKVYALLGLAPKVKDSSGLPDALIPGYTIDVSECIRKLLDIFSN